MTANGALLMIWCCIQRLCVKTSDAHPMTWCCLQRLCTYSGGDPAISAPILRPHHRFGRTRGEKTSRLGRCLIDDDESASPWGIVWQGTSTVNLEG
jgi:hypothetical protein